MTTVFSELDKTGVYALTYTPDVELAAATVLPENYSLSTLSGTEAKITNAYYYAEGQQVKLIVETKNRDAFQSWALSSQNLLSAEGEAADVSENVYLFSEAAVDYGTVSVSAVTLLKDGTPVESAAGESGIAAVIRICNTTGSVQNGQVKLYDGDALVADREYNIEGDGFEEVIIDVSEHDFVGEISVVLASV